MRKISTQAHGLLDFVAGGFLVAAPWLMGFAEGGAETWVLVVLGAAMLAYSMLTDYEMGFVRRLPMRTHRALDLGAGALLAASPWIFGFADQVWQPHLGIGLLAAGVALLTKTAPVYEVNGAGAGMSPRLRKGLTHKLTPGNRAQAHRDTGTQDIMAQIQNQKSKETRRYEA